MVLFSARARSSPELAPRRSRALWFVASPLAFLLASQHVAADLAEDAAPESAAGSSWTGPDRSESTPLRPLSPKERDYRAMLPPATVRATDH